jgi:signal transduction histidine kinase
MKDFPDTVRTLRAAAWMWIGYLATLGCIDWAIYAGRPLLPLVPFYASNGLAALIFLMLAYWQALAKKLGGIFTPLMIALIGGVPMFLSGRFPPGPLSNAEGMALRQLPILFIGLVLVAWQYRLKAVILFSLGTAILEMGIIAFLRPVGDFALFFFITIVRTVIFLIVGIFIGQLMNRLRVQRESLRRANAQLTHYASTLEKLTISRERNRMARELHDTLAHTLTGLSVSLETAKAYWGVDAAKARMLLENSLETTRNGIEETRRSLKSLRASPLEDIGLRLALERMAESAATRANLDLELVLPDPMPNLAPDVEQCLYRTAQEAIENVTHHADARRLYLGLENGAEGLILTVRDDGMGFDPQGNVAAGHFGLVGMKERAGLSGGKLTVNSQKGKGTAVILKI